MYGSKWARTDWLIDWLIMSNSSADSPPSMIYS